MITQTRPADRIENWQEQFVALLPSIENQASYAFRRLPPESREDAMQEVTANALVAFVRLLEKGRSDVALATPLAQFAIRQYRAGRRVGSSLNKQDVSSPGCQRHKGISLETLTPFDDEEGVWKEILVEDRNATPADLAASRIDFPAWLRTLSRRDRRIALQLARGRSTGVVAHLFRVSPARISQKRRELADAWRAFHGGPENEAAAISV